MADNPRSTAQTISEQVLILNCQIEDLATAGKWLEVGDSIKKRDAMLLEMDINEGPAALLEASRSTDRIRKLVEAARRNVADEISALMRGKKAADSYQANAF